VRRWIVAKKVRDPGIDGDDLLLGYFSATGYLAREGKVQLGQVRSGQVRPGQVRRESEACLKCGT
jgi:hypothetical protein